ncbi:MAG: M20/M25/M40 family metallo-hydrolase [Planctomycetota bacterium]
MSIGKLLLGCLVASLSAGTAHAQTQAPPEKAKLAQELLSKVSAQRLEKDVRTLAGFGTRHPLSETDSETRGTGAARRYLKAQLEAAAERSKGRMTVTEEPFTLENRRLGGEATFVNIIAHIEGRDDSRGVWVFGGHYDSRNSNGADGKGDAPGADDDASGTAVIVEMARVLAEWQPEADIYLCAFDGEEVGLLGSDHLAARLEEKGIVVEGMVTNDIVGSSTGPDGTKHENTLRVFSEGFAEGADTGRSFRNYAAETEGASRQLARYAALLADRYQDDFSVKLIYRSDRFGRGGDHLSFTQRGYPGVRFTEAAENYDHQHQDVRVEDGVQYGDLPEYCDFDYIARVARLNVAVAVNGAGAPSAPDGVRTQGAVRHDTAVGWRAVDGDHVAGYRVWRRPTDASHWTESVFVPKGETQHLLEWISIDDWQFAVSTVGTNGLESPPAFPALSRRRR